ncbi:DUF1774-domain-containing protein [Venustampulla echinocandica]|uniref:DUF1774-domain-containing protein n=1 Tax=Venustampulla echinocandica TaxID=2656787 RepID=A0A370TWI3_9HELO|nr:DUF1774-domain-containing protein [Venustampulla echinocandica]RDL39891.1 DUF1774-domain-containing protein [Venustampulla echinocandica]
MAGFEAFNPFAKRESYSAQSLWTYRALSVITWLLSVIATGYYNCHSPHNDKAAYKHTIPGQNRHYATPFSLNFLIVDLYWLALFVFQIAYVWHLFSRDAARVQAATGVGSHFILNNLLHFGFVMLFVRCYFISAEVLLVINFFNLSSLYFRHGTAPRLIHIGATSGPLAWTFVALYWNGAIMFGAHNLAARILANVAIWGILVYGLFFLVAYKDYTMGFALSILTASLGVGQFFSKIIAFQWIFAFTIMAVLFLATLGIAVPTALGKELSFRREGAAVSTDQERAPLLDDQ